MLKKTILANFQRIIELFAQKIVTKLSKVWVWDPGSGIGFFQRSKRHRIPDPGSGSATLFVCMIKMQTKEFYEVFGIGLLNFYRVFSRLGSDRSRNFLAFEYESIVYKYAF